jgi:hypothetical protein
MKNTTENNKLIANFLGQKEQPFEFPQFGYIRHDGEWKDSFHEDQLKFHKDWNWLMSVVDKIESLGYDVQIVLDYCTITDGDYSETTQLGGNKMHNVYNACVEFIKCYNEYNK